MDKPVAIVTGAGRGIGRAIALELARKGFDLALVARNQAELEETKRLAGRGLVLVADVGREDQINQGVQRVLRELKRVDVVVNNAGVAPSARMEQMTGEKWRQILDVNLSAAFYLIHAVWETMKEQKSGVIVNISSAASRDPFLGLGAYGAAKAGLNMLGLALSREGKEHGIRVHTIAPGAVETAMFRAMVSPEQWPADKTLSPEDVAKAVASCVDGDLRHTSGEVIFLTK